MATLGKWEGLISFTSAQQIAIVETGGGTATVTVAAAGDYYLTSATALLSAIATALTADGTLAATYTLSLDDTNDTSTGKVTITAAGGGVSAIAITWTTTTLRDVLGFSSGDTVSGAMTYTGSEQATHLWLPDCGPSEILAPFGYKGLPYRDVTVAIAPDGTTYSFAANGARYMNRIAYSQCKSNKVWFSHESVVNESHQTFYEAVVSQGLPFRFHSDRNVDGTYVTWVATQESARRMQSQWSDPAWVGSESYSRIAYDVVEWK